MQLYTASQVEQFSKAFPDLLIVKRWVENFLGKPNPTLGRIGAVCPYIPRALQIDSIRFAVVNTQDCSQEEIENLVKTYRDIFVDLEPKQGELALYKTILLIFPDISEEQAPKLIDGVQKKLKPFFVEQGLMIGEFHPRNETPGLHNSDFRPLRSPVPMLAIRFMVEADLPFLDQPTDNPDTQITYLKAYLRVLGSKIKDKNRLEQAQLSLEMAQQTRREKAQANYPKSTSKCPFAHLMRFRQLLNSLRPS